MGLSALTRELHANERPQLLTHCWPLTRKIATSGLRICCQMMVYATTSKVST